MWFQIATTLLLATSGLNALTSEEAAQITSAGGCSPPTNGYVAAATSASWSNGVTTIRTNHVPNHVWTVVNPNRPNAVDTTYTFNPPNYLADDKVVCLNQGAIGVSTNGVQIFNPTTIEGLNAKDEEEMDFNGGHTAPDGLYHYHWLPNNGIVWDKNNPASQFVAVAYDGYPIYSIGSGININSLDKCHGMFVNGQYRYIASDDHFPYYLGCYRGTPQYGRQSNIDCSAVTNGKVCTCQFGVIELKKKKRSLLDLLEEILDEKNKKNPELSWKVKKQNAICGGVNSGTSNTSGGSGGSGGNRRPPPKGGSGGGGRFRGGSW